MQRIHRRRPTGLTVIWVATLVATVVAGTVIAGMCSTGLCAADAPPAGKTWKNGPSTDPAFFPVAVWLQDPRNAEKYKAAGINTYVGLWAGPTEAQLTALKKAGMQVICAQNEVGLQHKDDPTIVAWMHGDEPDNAQEKKGGGYGPPVATQKIIDDYKAMVAKDPTRPVLLNLGQGVAWDAYIGRGVRSNHPEDYAEYMKGCDAVSFDIYPVAGETDPAVKERLDKVAFGVARLQKWADGKKRVWCCIECTRIGNVNRKPTPREIRSEVWQALIQGANGIVWFCHEFKPTFIEAAPLGDPETLKAMTAINGEIKTFAAALNSPAISDGLKVISESTEVPVAATVRHKAEAIYVFAAAARAGTTQASITVPGAETVLTAEVIGENRSVVVKGGVLVDSFKDWDVHLYKLVVLKP